MVSSKIHQELDLSRFSGKTRSIGSAALHLCFPLLYEGVFGTLQSRGVHIWDIGGAHAINRSVGFDFEYLAGGPLDYSTMTHGGAAADVILGGSRERISELRGALKR
jgi:fructose-1,6-bisphosphatase/inositol monophosphatase family enzyme